MKKLLALTILIVGCISVVNTTKNTNKNEKEENVELLQSGVSGGYEIVNNRPFSLNPNHFSYRDGKTGEVYVAGNASVGQLGVDVDTTINYSFPVYKNGIEANTFQNPKTFSFNGNSIILDESGKVYTSGFNNLGQTGNGSSGSNNKVTTFGLRNVGGSSTYNAVSVATGGSSSFVLLDNGALYGCGDSNLTGFSAINSTYSRIDGVTNLPTGEDKGGIVNFGGISNEAYVLFGDGDLYRSWYGGKWELTAQNVKLINYVESVGYYCFFMTYDNKVYKDYRLYDEPVLVSSSIDPDLEIKQFLAADYCFGYLTVDNDLYISSKDGSMPTASNSSLTYDTFYKFEEKILYAEMSAKSYTGVSYAILTEEGQIKLWGCSDNYKFGNGSNSSYPYEWAITPENGWFDSSTYPGVTTPPAQDDNTTEAPEVPGVTPEETDFSTSYPILRSHTSNNYNGANINTTQGIQLMYGTYLKLDYSNYKLESSQRIDINISSIDGTYSKDWTWSALNDDITTNYPVLPNFYIVTSKLMNTSNEQVGGSNEVTYEILKETLSLSVSSQLRLDLQGDDIYSTEGSLYEASYNKIMSGLLNGLYISTNMTIYSNNENNIFSTTSFDNIGSLTTNENWSIYFTNASVTTFNKSLSITTLERGVDYKIWIMLDDIDNYDINDTVTTSFSISTITANDENNSTPETLPEDVTTETIIETVNSPMIYVTSTLAIVAVLWAFVVTTNKKNK